MVGDEPYVAEYTGWTAMNLLHTESRKARKEHQCMLCGRPIAKGETHMAQVSTDDGCIYTWRAHSSCDDAAQREFSMQDWEESGNMDFGWFRTEILGEAIHEAEVKP